MSNLLIVGAGGHGRCCLDIARSMNIFDKIAFLDDLNVGKSVNDCMIIDSINKVESYVNEYDAIFVAIGNNAMRQLVCEKAKSIGYEIVNLISPLSFVSSYAKFGNGVVVFPFASVEANAIVEDGCVIGANSTINHDAHVEKYCLVNTSSIIRPNTLIGNKSKIGCNCVVSFGISIVPNSDIKDGLILD